MPDRNVLYVESANDQHVCYALCEHHKIPEVFTVIAKTGISSVFATVASELKKNDDDSFQRIGMLIDADDNIVARWQEITRLLQRKGYMQIPAAPEPTGTIIVQDDRPVIGIWLMPNNTQAGELEDFIATLVPDNDRLWLYAEQTLQSLVERRFRDQDTRKVHVHTWLAWQSEPGHPMGYAIGRRFLDPDAFLALQLIAWIRRLFPVDAP